MNRPLGDNNSFPEISFIGKAHQVICFPYFPRYLLKTLFIARLFFHEKETIERALPQKAGRYVLSQEAQVLIKRVGVCNKSGFVLSDYVL